VLARFPLIFARFATGPRLAKLAEASVLVTGIADAPADQVDAMISRAARDVDDVESAANRAQAPRRVTTSLDDVLLDIRALHRWPPDRPTLLERAREANAHLDALAARGAPRVLRTPSLDF